MYENLKVGQKLEIHCYKHNGKIDRVKLLYEDKIIVDNEKEYDLTKTLRESGISVSELNNVLFPTFGSPTIPSFIIYILLFYT